MIIANITDREHYYSLHPKMKQLWDYILTHDLANSPTGRINIDGDRLFVNVDNTQCRSFQHATRHRLLRRASTSIHPSASRTVLCYVP